MDSHNPYFSRWFSAIKDVLQTLLLIDDCHNPYFSRWFSAIKKFKGHGITKAEVTILILVDGFLQYGCNRF